MKSIELVRNDQRVEEVLARAQRPTRPGGARPVAVRLTRGIHRWVTSTRLALARAI